MSRETFRAYIPQESAINYVVWYAGISESVVVTEHVAAFLHPKDDKFLALSARERPIASSPETAIFWTWSLSRVSRFIEPLNFSRSLSSQRLNKRKECQTKPESGRGCFRVRSYRRREVLNRSAARHFDPHHRGGDLRHWNFHAGNPDANARTGNLRDFWHLKINWLDSNACDLGFDS